MGRLRLIKHQVADVKPRVREVKRVGVVGSWQADHADERAFMKTAEWQRLRWSVLVRDAFTCQWDGCGKVVDDTSQLVADHKIPVRVAPHMKWDESNLWCLCRDCHNGPKQQMEREAWG